MPTELRSEALAPAAALLCAMLEADTLPHALLMEGSTQAQRLEAATALARALVCTGPEQAAPQEDETSMFGGLSLFGEEETAPLPEADIQAVRVLPCGECAHCRKSGAGVHPDIKVIEGGAGARSFHIDVIRALRQEAFVLPNEAGCKVFVLHNAQSMTAEAQNALLKLLEEPPSYLCLILTAPARKTLLSTVISRVFTLSLGEAVQEALDAQAEQKLQQLSQNIARAMAQGGGYALLEATAPLEGDKDLLREALPAVRRQLHTILLQNTAQPQRLLELMEGVRALEFALERNANLNLLLTQLASICAG